MKLLGVERILEVFEREGEALVAEYPVNLDIDILAKIVKPGIDDPLLYGHYPLGRFQTKKLLAEMNLYLMIETKTYRYFLSCFGIYDYESK